MIEGTVTRPWIQTPKPNLGVGLDDPNWGTRIMRVTDHTRQKIGGFLGVDYSRRQQFNADKTLQLAYALDGHWHLIDPRTGAYVKRLNGLASDCEPQWHPTKPNVLFYLPTYGIGLHFNRLDVITNTQAASVDLGPRLKEIWPSANAMWTSSEGSPSANSQWWCFMVDAADWRGLGFFTYNRWSNQILGWKPYSERPNWVSMSPTGKFCVVSYYGGPGVIVWDRHLKTQRKIADIGEHSDIGLDANGDDVYVSIDYNDGSIFMVRLKDGVRTNLVPTYVNGTTSAFLFSAKCYDRPGWVLISSYAESTTRPTYAQQWLHRKVFLLELKEGGRVFNVCDTHVEYEGYWTAPKASISRDMSLAAFNSNWDTASEDVDVYNAQIAGV